MYTRCDTFFCPFKVDSWLIYATDKHCAGQEDRDMVVAVLHGNKAKVDGKRQPHMSDAQQADMLERFGSIQHARLVDVLIVVRFPLALMRNRVPASEPHLLIPGCCPGEL